jgi:hypothetical protein
VGPQRRPRERGARGRARAARNRLDRFLRRLLGVLPLRLDSSIFLSAQYRGTGRNDFGYKYGNIAMANVAYGRKISEVFDAVVEMNFRHAGRDQVDSRARSTPTPAAASCTSRRACS